MGNGRHALFAFYNTSSGADFCHSGEEVATIAYARLNSHTKSIIDRPEYCGCVTSHRTGRAEFVCGLDRDKLVEQLF